MIEHKLKVALRALKETGGLPILDIPHIRVERPKDDQFGEYTSNVALIIAKQVGKNPKEVAGMIQEELLKNKEEKDIEKIDVAGPGHLNFFLSRSALTSVLLDVLEKREHFGESMLGTGERINNEFISANPTGPLHLGNARGGFFGDTLSRVLRKTGFDVVNEYYVNDAGEQVMKLGHSVLKDDEAVYGGEYIEKLAERLVKNKSVSDARGVGEQAAHIVMEEMIKPVLADKMNVRFDVFSSERQDVVESGLVDEAIALLKTKELTYENEGALWLKTTAFGDDKDRVLIKGDGTKTYFASDCGYMLAKMNRQFSRFILTLGADHHGYVARLRAAARALGFSGKFDVVLVQMVRLIKDGQEVRMSKRRGTVVTVDELIERVGGDMARFFFLLYSPDTHMNFDLGLAEEHSQKNPVFYVKYAHARLASILRKAEEEKYVLENADLTLLTHEKERELLREILFFPELLEEIGKDFSVHRLPQYAIRLSDKLHSFYGECRVLDGDNHALSLARLSLILAVKVVLGETLNVMGIEAPEKM